MKQAWMLKYPNMDGAGWSLRICTALFLLMVLEVTVQET